MAPSNKTTAKKTASIPLKAAPKSKRKLPTTTTTPAAAAVAPTPTSSIATAPTSSEFGSSNKGPKLKKPKSDKSTSTKTTPTAQKPVNVYDAVLGEAQDLLSAAQEAQALGRLKMASAYQMLLHARLVGLGKRFDRAQIQGAPEGTTVASLRMSPEGDSKVAAAAQSTPDHVAADDSAKSPQMEDLARFLPSNIELDSIMMEHLARAAVELHHKRTGRRIQADSLLASPPPTAGMAVAMAAASASSRVSTGPGNIGWTEEEMTKVTRALKDGLTSPADVARAVGTRTEAQVRAYLRLAEQHEKGAQAVEQELGDESPRKHRGGRGRKPATQAMNTVPNANLDARALLKGKAV